MILKYCKGEPNPRKLYVDEIAFKRFFPHRVITLVCAQR